MDSSVWVSALLTPKGNPAVLLGRWKNGAFQNVCSIRILQEVGLTLREPRIFHKYGLESEEIDRYLELLAGQSLLVAAPGRLKLCRDPNDDHVLEAALTAKAEYVVSRDDDIKRDIALLKLFESFGVQIVSVRQFLRLLSSEGRGP